MSNIAFKLLLIFTLFPALSHAFTASEVANFKGKYHSNAYYPKFIYTQKGTASWYGAAFMGKKTASGTKFHPEHLTAAHNTLPLGSVVMVTNLKNQKQIAVIINDRGPFVSGSNGAKTSKTRVIDLSQRAARELGFVNNGLAPVKIEYLYHSKLPSRSGVSK